MSQLNLVTGGLGFIGNHLVRFLLKTGNRVILIDNLSNAELSYLEEFKMYDGFNFIEHDISKPLPTIHDKVETVFNLAALVSVPDSFSEPLRTHQVNETGFINVLNFCKTHQVKKLVYASSCAVYGESTNFPLQESECIVPTSPYGLTKLNNERYAKYFHQAYGLESTGLRFFNVFGPGQKATSAYAGVISIFMDRAMNKQPITIYGDGSQIRDFVFVQDIVKALMKGAENGNPLGVYNIGTGKGITVNELFGHIKEITGYPLDPVYENPRIGDVAKSISDPSKFQSDANYSTEWDVKSGLEALFQSLK